MKAFVSTISFVSTNRILIISSRLGKNYEKLKFMWEKDQKDAHFSLIIYFT